ncbi:unnamed protein product [Spirodela intermedia]|uniref:Phosphatidic acid phosphatase type 2/haloperoxidase domain-containing protein n=1 Tax=Spirodela intermedia TaxID=51605 RepID=A0A7I8J6R2_SPIIN|nr:unnamed protein product [Spirodela intermedia]CAA6665415.1 unnamed protein product [Spirodela intermedia]
MREVQLGAHTIQSHGAKLAKTHMHDWLILVLLLAIVVILNVIHPFYRFVGKDMMDDLKYPLKSNTVPVWAVPIVAVLVPVLIFLAFYYRRRDVYDLHHAILGLLFSVLITAVITDAIKDAVGRPRPDFFWRCFPDGKELYDQVTGNVICHGEGGVVKEGHKSFPSGHTSWSFAGLGFLALYLSGKIKAFDRRGHVAKLCIVFLPCWSRPSSESPAWTTTGTTGRTSSPEPSSVRTVAAGFCYLQFFPLRWGTYAYFQMLESRASVNPAAGMNDELARGEGGEGSAPELGATGPPCAMDLGRARYDRAAPAALAFLPPPQNLKKLVCTFLFMQNFATLGGSPWLAAVLRFSPHLIPSPREFSYYYYYFVVYP